VAVGWAVGVRRSPLLTGSGDHIGCFESLVAGIGLQIGYLFPIPGMQRYKAYAEFDAADRPSGWNTWVTFSISPATTTPTTPPPPTVTK